MRDLVERLRDPEFRGEFQHLRDWSDLDQMHEEAAAEITRLTEEVERLNEENRLSMQETVQCRLDMQAIEKRAEATEARVKELEWEVERGYYGHKTMADGSHVPLTKDEAAALMDHLAAIHARREADMPTARDALSAIIAAEERLRDLGWWRGGGLRVRRGDNCAVIQQGSTGMWHGLYQDDGKYVLFGDSVCGPRDCWMKSLAELTADERNWMQECDKREAEAHEALHRRMTHHASSTEIAPTLSHKEG